MINRYNILSLVGAIGTILIIFILISNIKATDNKSLTEVQKLKAENFKLSAQLIQCEMKANNAKLQSEQLSLVNEFRKQLDAKDTDTFDWNSLSFISQSK